MAGEFHRHSPVNVNTSFTGVGRPCMSKVMEAEIFDSRLFQGAGWSGLDALQKLSLVRET